MATGNIRVLKQYIHVFEEGISLERVLFREREVLVRIFPGRRKLKPMATVTGYIQYEFIENNRPITYVLTLIDSEHEEFMKILKQKYDMDQAYFWTPQIKGQPRASDF